MPLAIDYRPALVNREGIGRYVREMVRGLLFDGIAPDITLFAGTLKPSYYSKYQLGLIHSQVHMLRPRIPTRWFKKWLELRKMGVDDYVGGVCLYHQTQWSPLPVRRATEVATIFDCIYALDAGRNDGPGYLPRDAAERMLASARELARRSQVLLVPSQYVAKQVVEHLGAKPEQVRVTPLGCDHLPPPSSPAVHLPHGTRFLITAARIDRRKNHVLALRVFERLVAKGFPHHWVVVGPLGYGYQDFVEALRQSPVRHRVHWLRMVEDGELSSLLAAADLMLWPSHNEGFGLPPLEAMANGTPVVTSRCTSLEEVCGDAAILLDPSDEDGFFEACCRLLEDHDYARHRVEVGFEHATQFTWRHTAKATLAVYRELLAEHEAQAGS
ncbi:MAG: glycosyltransferase family 4 protein [Planctomycetes bacterium]|nr:glycosyltransferase family 4 protein [Planctomycetota bacterium]MCB9908867.1 glycosyltransferase family 4 protein [Planctomycetota bacterium]HPF14132.1 glycosyltransferase family 1 protein [Planctomycetota bacterium]HRV80584.1 glycosyltransferase family 1 protein [Planctomycetota bacterium]